MVWDTKLVALFVRWFSRFKDFSDPILNEPNIELALVETVTSTSSCI